MAHLEWEQREQYLKDNPKVQAEYTEVAEKVEELMAKISAAKMHLGPALFDTLAQM